MLLTAMLAMNTAVAAPVDDKEMGVGVSIGYPVYAVTAKLWGTADMLPGIMEDGPGGLAIYAGYKRYYSATFHLRANLEKDFWTPPFEFGFADQAVYYGVGVNADISLGYFNLGIGVGGVIGWQLALNAFPLEIAFQIEPGVQFNLLGDRYYYNLIQFRYYGGLLARYYF